METFSTFLAICAGNSPVTPHKDQWCGSLIFPLICAWINGWVNNREAGDLRRHRAHHDVTVMLTEAFIFCHGQNVGNSCLIITDWTSPTHGEIYQNQSKRKKRNITIHPIWRWMQLICEPQFHGIMFPNRQNTKNSIYSCQLGDSHTSSNQTLEGRWKIAVPFTLAD